MASKLLAAAVRHSPPDSRCWGNAMLRELDFVESDWAAVLWALGSTTAILKHAVPRGVRAWLVKHAGKRGERVPKSIARSVAGLASGVVISACVLAACLFGLSRLSLVLFPEWQLNQRAWAQWLALLGMPEAIFVITAVVLWRKRRTVAAGILLGAVILIMHVIVHIATHG